MNVKRGLGPWRCFICGFEDHFFPEWPNKRHTICDSSGHNHTTVLVGGQEPEDDGDRGVGRVRHMGHRPHSKFCAPPKYPIGLYFRCGNAAPILPVPHPILHLREGLATPLDGGGRGPHLNLSAANFLRLKGRDHLSKLRNSTDRGCA